MLNVGVRIQLGLEGVGRGSFTFSAYHFLAEIALLKQFSARGAIEENCHFGSRLAV